MTSSLNNNTTFIISNISQPVSIKLDRHNYLLWKSQFMSVLKGHGLVDFVDGTHPCPNEFLPNLEGKETAAVNPKYTKWHRQDQNLLSWINATLSETVLPYVVGLPTSEIVWATLDRRFSALSRSHIMQLKDQIHSVKKGMFSASKYLLNIKQLSDRLAYVGKPMDDVDLVLVTLNGLPSEFASFRLRSKCDMNHLYLMNWIAFLYVKNF
ncbi:hypothetical protein GIB67_012883 [Kingdonia uniflora]|uniref:Retrotransposon Copia-like N-terminal domain-containing protein n=1 Tax=Kingdonia uniflora TaxID=39325 RepID=A0A7J7NFM5_9MAGN|nr:hypothetical protein GIB67_012883 [Kingdonia uniflora]